MPGVINVYCKIPTGLVLQVFVSDDTQEPIMGGGSRTVKKARRVWRFRLNGSAVPEKISSPHPIFYGAALTPGVDADMFAKWIEQNKDSEVVRLGLVKGAAKPSELELQAKEHADVKTGLERMDRKNLPSEFQGRHKIEAATTQPAL